LIFLADIDALLILLVLPVEKSSDSSAVEEIVALQIRGKGG